MSCYLKVIDQRCFYIYLHNKLLATGISLYKNPPVNNVLRSLYFGSVSDNVSSLKDKYTYVPCCDVKVHRNIYEIFLKKKNHSNPINEI